ncbi:hypothetical protein SCLCIDRAFT_1215452 [Scleroderma citrinum Foug A]|uniref:Uncharacterized protein n=1 Tax=Scleroderma citrinum Foug A TaxID=1036808 RepID=A0A0C3E0V3_9AGAM|nr:hypothetical protein SCLCIDRAFT_1215452 [Scleroderma citrinum Foug A]
MMHELLIGRGCNVRYPPNGQDYHWLVCSTLNITLFLKACNIKSSKFHELKKSIRDFASEHLKPDLPIDSQVFEVNLVIGQAAATHHWLEKYEDYWPARLYLMRYWKQKHRAALKLNRLNQGHPVKTKKRKFLEAPPPPNEPPPNEPDGENSHKRDKTPSISSTGPEDGSNDPTLTQASEPFLVSDDVPRPIDSSGPVLSELSAPANVVPRHGCTGPQVRSSSSSGLQSDDDTRKTTTGRDFVKDFLRSVSPSLEAYLDAFVMLGIYDQTTLGAFLAWPRQMQLQWLNDENQLLRMTRLEMGAFLLCCENVAGQSS